MLNMGSWLFDSSVTFGKVEEMISRFELAEVLRKKDLDK
jgi:hypothetical protein